MKTLKRALIIFIITYLSISAVCAAETSDLSCTAYVQNFGWLNPVSENEIAGTVGEGLNLEGFSINTTLGTITYSSYVSKQGWQESMSNGEYSGTQGQNLPVEAIKLQLDETLSQEYDLYYRVHCANLGWLGWAKNGQEAGTTGLAIPMQAMEIQLVEKDSPVSLNMNIPYLDKEYVKSFSNVEYQLHCSGIGWQETKSNQQTAGTIGESRQAEALKVIAPDLTKLDPESHINYTVHGHGYGWQGVTSDNNVAGTEGQSLNIQAVNMYLTGQAQCLYDLYYRVHVSDIGWLDWASNGDNAGTTGLDLPIEAIEIVLLPKNENAPGNTDTSFLTRGSLQGLEATVQSSIENLGWVTPTSGDIGTGTEGQCLGIEALKMSVPNLGGNSGIVYNLYIENIGWQGERADDQEAGTTGQNLQAEAITIRLTGALGQLFDVYYTTSCQDQGWLGWTCNNGIAGTSNGNKKLECLKVDLVLKGDPVPNNGIAESYREIQNKITADQVPNFNLICAIVQHEGGASYEGALAVMSCVMNRVDSGRWGGNDPVSVLTAPGQFASYLDGYYRQFLNNPSPVVQQAVLDCLNGARSHPYQSFRSYPTSGSVNIGGNWFF